MYGRVMGTSSAAVGATILPNTGDSTPLFFVALSLLLLGLATLAVYSFMVFKNRKNEAK